MNVGDRVTVRVIVDGKHVFKEGTVQHIYDPPVVRRIEVKLDDFWVTSDVVRCRTDDVIVAKART